MKKLFLAILVATAGTLIAADEPKTEIKAAAKKLADQSSYGWTSTPKGADGTVQPGEIVGKTEKGGFTYYTINFNANNIEVAFKGEKSAIQFGGTWYGIDELTGDQEWIAGRLKSFKAPAGEVERLADQMTDLKKNTDGSYSGTLTEEGAKSLLTTRGGTAEVSEARGKMKIWVKDGQLSKFEYQLQGKAQIQGTEREIDRTTTVEIKDVGSTKVEVPQDGKSKLS